MTYFYKLTQLKQPSQLALNNQLQNQICERARSQIWDQIGITVDRQVHNQIRSPIQIQLKSWSQVK